MPGTLEDNSRDKGVLASCLAIYQVFYPKVKYSNLVLTEEDLEELTYQGFPSGCSRKIVGQRDIEQTGILSAEGQVGRGYKHEM